MNVWGDECLRWWTSEVMNVRGDECLILRLWVMNVWGNECRGDECLILGRGWWKSEFSQGVMNVWGDECRTIYKWTFKSKCDENQSSNIALFLQKKTWKLIWSEKLVWCVSTETMITNNLSKKCNAVVLTFPFFLFCLRFLLYLVSFFLGEVTIIRFFL